jgi:hypothetical protein
VRLAAGLGPLRMVEVRVERVALGREVHLGEDLLLGPGGERESRRPGRHRAPSAAGWRARRSVPPPVRSQRRGRRRRRRHATRSRVSTIVVQSGIGPPISSYVVRPRRTAWWRTVRR